VTKPTLNQKLNSIRTCIDSDVTGCDIDTIVEKGKSLAQMMGLSAECKAEAKKNLENRLLIAVHELGSKSYPPSVLLRVANAMCADEAAAFEYADRLNAGITHQLDYYRTVISLHKCELENSLK
jgi:hypothetical protein